MNKYAKIQGITIVVLYICLILCLTIPCYGKNESISWYCIRNKDHRQPVADQRLSVVESHEGYYVDKKHGDSSSDKVVYLTFDAGYENGNIEKILNVLKEEQVPAAFFVLGNLIQKNTDLVKRMISEGHLVCNHTMHHHDMTKMGSEQEFARELLSLESLYTEKTGQTLAKYYRPPEGRFTEDNLRYAEKLGYKTIFWSIAYADWDNEKQPTTQYAKNKILENLHNGAVILLHPTSATNATIIKDLITEIRAQGYRFGTLDELTK